MAFRGPQSPGENPVVGLFFLIFYSVHCPSLTVVLVMDVELQELRELVAQLKADNERLWQEQAAAVPGPSSESSTSSVPPVAPVTIRNPIAERLVFVPRDRKCPMFRGKSGMGLTEWLEEVQACMRARHLSTSEQAFFLVDHLEGEAQEEIKYLSDVEREDSAKIISVLQELYGCSKSYVALQEAFFSRRQQEGETLHEFSLALLSLMESVKVSAPGGMTNADVLLRDQFVEHVLDGALRRELKQLVRRQATATLLDVWGEAIRWEREGLPGGGRGRSHSSSAFGLQYGVQSGSQGATTPPQGEEMVEMREMLRLQQEQLNQLTQSIATLQPSHLRRPPPRRGPVICRRCQQPGHYASECGGVRVSARAQSSLPGRQPSNRHFHQAQESEN